MLAPATNNAPSLKSHQNLWFGASTSEARLGFPRGPTIGSGAGHCLRQEPATGDG